MVWPRGDKAGNLAIRISSLNILLADIDNGGQGRVARYLEVRYPGQTEEVFLVLSEETSPLPELNIIGHKSPLAIATLEKRENEEANYSVMEDGCMKVVSVKVLRNLPRAVAEREADS